MCPPLESKEAVEIQFLLYHREKLQESVYGTYNFRSDDRGICRTGVNELSAGSSFRRIRSDPAVFGRWCGSFIYDPGKCGRQVIYDGLAMAGKRSAGL